MKTIVSLTALIGATLLATAALAANSEDRTSMPENCTDRNVNCVINDGPPRRRGQQPPPPPPPDQKKSNDKKGNDNSGR